MSADRVLGWLCVLALGFVFGALMLELYLRLQGR